MHASTNLPEADNEPTSSNAVSCTDTHTRQPSAFRQLRRRSHPRNQHTYTLNTQDSIVQAGKDNQHLQWAQKCCILPGELSQLCTTAPTRTPSARLHDVNEPCLDPTNSSQPHKSPVGLCGAALNPALSRC